MPSSFLVLALLLSCGGGEVTDEEASVVEEAAEVDEAAASDPLPPAVEACWDDIQGAWVGMHQDGSSWIRFTLRIRRIRPFSPKLTGMLTAHYWEGGMNQVQPPKCSESGGDQFLAHQRAEGRFNDPTVEFQGVEVVRLLEVCGKVKRYYPDKFIGSVDASTQIFHATMDDGHSMPAEVEFRRVACVDVGEVDSWWDLAWDQVRHAWKR